MARLKILYGLRKWSPVTCKLRYMKQHSNVLCSFSTSAKNFSDSSDVEDNVDDKTFDALFKRGWLDNYLSPDLGHRVFVLQPDLKRIRRVKSLTTVENQLEEACALVHCLPNWKVVGSTIRIVNCKYTSHMFGKGSFEELTALIRQQRGVSAVFFNIDVLSGLQLSTFQHAWKLPVYDRYTLVLQIFKLRAQTKEAKLQVALAEIPYYRSRMFGITTGDLNKQTSESIVFTSSGSTWIETRKRVLGERERTLRQALDRIRVNRDVLRQGRKRTNWPVVAVVGYTNAGKTSLIKALTNDAKLEPKDQLFATLDVTLHPGRLGNNLKVFYTDTVGFISDIPTDLIASFSATLEDIFTADVILHVRDISHPDRNAQKANVLGTLAKLNLPQHLQDNIIEIANKADKMSSDELGAVLAPGAIAVSATTGVGLHALMDTVTKSLLASSDSLLVKRFRIPMSGRHLAWLYKHATVEQCNTCDRDTEYLIVNVIISPKNYAQFLANFGKPNSSANLRVDNT